MLISNVKHYGQIKLSLRSAEKRNPIDPVNLDLADFYGEFYFPLAAKCVACIIFPFYNRKTLI